MHPLFGRASRFLLYSAGWLVLGVLLALPLAGLTHRPLGGVLAFTVPLCIVYGEVCLAAWWVCLSRPLGEPVRAVLSQLTAALLCATIWGVTATVWGNVLARAQGLGAPDRTALFNDVAVLFGLGVPLYLLSAVAHYLYLAIEEAHASAQRSLELQVSAREAELRAVRSQLNPHFLFNSLNSINALVGSDPEGARRMCEGLGDFLRRTLQLGAREAVTLDDELALVDRYLAIEQVRFGARLAVEREVAPEARACLLPPLLLQPLVENAVQHGLSGSGGGTVRIVAKRDGGSLVLEVSDRADGEARAASGTFAEAAGARGAGEGLGLANTQARLAAFLGTCGTQGVSREEPVLDLVRGPHGATVRIRLPLVQPPPGDGSTVRGERTNGTRR